MSTLAPARAPGVAVPKPPRAFATGEEQDRERLRAAPLRTRPRPSRLGAGIATLRGAGPRLAEAASELGVDFLGDLLWHVPHGYRDRTTLSEIADLRLGQEATVLAEVRTARLRPTRRRGLTILEATVADASGPTKAVWFNQPWLADQLGEGTRALLHGKLDRVGFKVDAHEVIGADVAASRGAPTGLHTTGIVPVHPASARLRPQKIREWAWQARRLAVDAIEPLPARTRARLRLAGGADALSAAHFPMGTEDAATARERLAFEELFLHQAALATRRHEHDSGRRAPRLDAPGELTRAWLESLPFELTGDQRRATEEVDADLASEHPMQRLLMGEVGSGKTVCALHAMLRAVESGHQAALMAPTETLAEQHFQTLERLLSGAGLPSAALLTGSTSAARRREHLGHLASGQLELAVGTHALIETDVSFARLALAVVDEQHRFGVRQRAALDAKGPGEAAPHTLHMTATPIPRTLSLTAYGDLDVTVLRELPAGRQPVKTWVVGEEKRAGAYEFIRERLREGRQAFVVCPLVSESDKLQARAATKEGERLAKGEFRDFEVGVLHGQMKAAEKQRAMHGFASGDTQVLVATSVIEVGIDVPNASVMVIEEADRYGLSQLHQLRGRVGRGEHESACILFADPSSEAANLRLEAISSERDGFKLAEVDLSLRGEGEILGTRQHGLPRFRVASLPEDSGTLLRARDEVLTLLRRHGSLDAPELGPLMDAARLRFGDERAEPIAA
ncbi:MAG TPA: ATP-dependent DNA helicase RecG [Solirubrobacterales bacterium]|nr:ATP-dependent DNA helicase RecG [Solirubrobacterales bacterium]